MNLQNCYIIEEYGGWGKGIFPRKYFFNFLFWSVKNWKTFMCLTFEKILVMIRSAPHLFEFWLTEKMKVSSANNAAQQLKSVVESVK